MNPTRPVLSRLGRALFALALFGAASLFGPSLARAADEIVVLSGGGAHRITVLPIEGAKGPEVALEEVSRGLDVSFSRAGRDASVTLRSGGREVTLENGRSLFSAGGQLRALPAPVRVVGERTYVGPAAAATILAAALGQPAVWRAPYRALLIGAYEPPRFRVTNTVGPTSIESSLEFTKPAPWDIRREPNRLIVTFQADVVDTDFSSESLPGRIVAAARFERGTPSRLIFDLGDRFAASHTVEKDPLHVSFVFDSTAANAGQAPGSPTSQGTSAAPAPPPSAARPQAPSRNFRKPIVLVIDPGHGGEDTGARGPAGRLEKDLTLAVARRVRAAAVDSLSVQAYLTRDTDIALDLDERAAIANNFNADIFLSIHANGSRVASASGTEVFFLSYTAVDDEARRVALQEGAVAERAPTADKDVGLILWDMAQAAQLEASSKLATSLHASIAEASLSRSRGVKQAPFRVLVGATMPASLLEIGFITNPAEEKLLFTDEHQARLTDAIIRGLAQFVAALRANP